MMKELDVTEFDAVNGGSENSIDWSDEGWGMADMLGGLYIMATSPVDLGAGLVGGGLLFARGANYLAEADKKGTPFFSRSPFFRKSP